MSPKKLIPLSLLAMYLIWGSTYLAIRIAIESIPPLLMTSARLFLAGMILFLFLLLRGHKLPTKRQWGNAFIVGGLMLGGGLGATSFAEKWVESGLAAILVATVPLWTTLVAGIWERWPTRREWVGLLVGFAGVILLNVEDNLQANPLGAFLLLLAPISWALGSALSRRVDLAKGSMAFASEMLAGSGVLLVVALLLGEQITMMPTVSSLLAWLYLSLLGSLVAYSAYMYLLQNTPITVATSYAYVNPIIAVLLGIWLADESISMIGIVAMLIILIAVIVLTTGRRTVPPVTEAAQAG
jgi:drug/metabolite transporter (DMT)-like permease